MRFFSSTVSSTRRSHYPTLTINLEADVFLTKRSTNGSQNGDLVSGEEFLFMLGEPLPKSYANIGDLRTVLLRQIEYFRGILFLTTNLLENIDEAFMSRIQLHLCFPALDHLSRLHIWEKNLSRLEATLDSSSKVRTALGAGKNLHPGPKVCVSRGELQDLAQWQLNGRHIRNVVRNTHLWCLYNSFDLTHERLVATIPVTAPFAERDFEEGTLQPNRKRARIET